MSSFRLVARGRYSLAAQSAFLRGLAPALYEGGAGAAIDLASEAWRPYRSWVAVLLRSFG